MTRFSKTSALVASLLFCAFFLLNVFAVLAGPAKQKGGDGAGLLGGRSGDVNGDEKIDISDAIYLFQWLFKGGPAPVACALDLGDKFDNFFSMPREPETLLTPGLHFDMKVPPDARVLITDVYVENLGSERSEFRILQQTGPNTFEVRYTFRTAAGQTTIISFSTGLKLGDEAPIAGNIRIENSTDSRADILPRVNGIVVP